MSDGNFGLALKLPLALLFSAAKLMEWRPFVIWLGKGFEIRPQNANGVAAHMGRLLALSQPNPAMREPIREFANAIIPILPRQSQPQLGLGAFGGGDMPQVLN